MIIIDFDDTLFDTQSFKLMRYKALARLGVTDNIYWDSYKKARNSSDGLFTYSNERHANELAKYGYKKEEVLNVLDHTTTREALSSLLLDGAHDMLDAFNERFESMILLSLGDESFQEIKTKGTRVHKKFDRIFYVDKTKHDVVADLLARHKTEHIWFVNDKIEETKKLAAAFPQISAVLKVSPRFELSEYEASGLPFFHELKDIVAYVNEHAV